MNSDMIEAIASLIVALATCGGLIIPVIKKKYRDKQERYYRKVLLPFVEVYHKNEEMDIIKYFLGKYTRDKEYIPPYLFYICDKSKNDNDTSSNDKMKKVLLMDYQKYYKNCNNIAMQVIWKIDTILSIVACMITMSFVFFLVYVVMTQIIGIAVSILKTAGIIEKIIILRNHIIPISVLLILILFASLFFNHLQQKIDDEYSLRKKEIEKIISSKVSSYDKYHEEYQL